MSTGSAILAKEFEGKLWIPADMYQQVVSAAYLGGVLQEREACANICKEKAAGWREEDMHTWPDGRRSSMGDCWYQHRAEGADDCEASIRARGLGDLNKQAEKNGEEL